MSDARLVVLCCDGFYQRELIRSLRQCHKVVGVVLQVAPGAKGSLWQRLARYRSPVVLWRYLVARRELARDASSSRPLFEQLFPLSDGGPDVFDGLPVLRVGQINDAAAVAFVRDLQPDLLCVNGTQLLRQPMLAVAPDLSLGIINLHTGLSPYTRGGNCNLFALLDGHPEWVGVTVHHIDAGIDTGDLIITAQVPLAADDCYAAIDIKTFRLGIDLMLVGVRQLLDGRAARVKQWGAGKAYLRKTGYVYEPFQRVIVNRMLRRGLIEEYLADKTARDAAVRLVGDTC